MYNIQPLTARILTNNVSCENLSNIVDIKRDTNEIIPYKDGPYVKWKNRKLRAVYFYVDERRGRTKISRKKLIATTDTFQLKGFAFDSNNYSLYKKPSISKAHWNGVEKIIALGDIHGEFCAMVNFLKNNNIIDKDLNWTWGNGHLVLIGDNGFII